MTYYATHGKVSRFCDTKQKLLKVCVTIFFEYIFQQSQRFSAVASV